MEGGESLKGMQSLLDVSSVVNQEEIPVETKTGGLRVVTVESSEQGLGVAKGLLYFATEKVPAALLLSGGTTPKGLYQQLALERRLRVKSCAMVDERFDLSGEKTNERMIRKTGLLDYLKSKGIPFERILNKEVIGKLEKTFSKNPPSAFHEAGILGWLTGHYSVLIERLIKDAQVKKIAIMGIGEDGHTAGVAPNTKDFINPLFGTANIYRQSDAPRFVDCFFDYRDMDKGGFGNRITMTFEGLGRMDGLIVLAFGSAKQNALEMMLRDGPIEEIPARFYTREDIAKKTILITDQKI